MTCLDRAGSHAVRGVALFAASPVAASERRSAPRPPRLLLVHPAITPGGRGDGRAFSGAGLRGASGGDRVHRRPLRDALLSPPAATRLPGRLPDAAASAPA